MPSIPSSFATGTTAGDAAVDGISILLVEDEPTTRLMITRQLTRAGYVVEAVSNGAEALERLKEQHFPLLLTDWDMPEMDGVALCKAVREMPLEGYVYTILLSAREGTANITEGLAAGADDYITKPPDDSELRARLNTGRRILKLEQSLRAANQQNYLLSITDVLTLAFNRRYLMEQLAQELKRACRYGRSLSVILCDIDYFKAVNDSRGHQAGDDVLKGFAGLLMDSIRKGIDWVARYGGEEFLIVVPETSVAPAVALATKLRDATAKRAFESPHGAIHITASFGVSGCDPLPDQQHGASVDALIANADLCLYRAKEEGRNRVISQKVALNEPVG